MFDSNSILCSTLYIADGLYLSSHSLCVTSLRRKVRATASVQSKYNGHEIINLFSGHTLEETAALFDGETLPEQIVSMAGEAATMSMHRPPEYAKAKSTEERYEKAPQPGPEYYELGFQKSRTNTDSASSRIGDPI